MDKKVHFMPTCDDCKKSSKEIYVCHNCAKYKRLCDNCWNSAYPKCRHMKMQCAYRTSQINPRNQILKDLLENVI